MSAAENEFDSSSADLPVISEAEWHVMREFWKRGTATTAEVADVLRGERSWKPGTILTLINRLVNKGALSFTKRGREHVYSPTVAEGDYAHRESRSLLDRVFQGRLAPLVACLVDREKVSDADLDELREILDRKRGGDD